MDSLTHSYQIPQDIIDIIIDDDSHNAETYKTFALVSKSFLHSSRKHLFRSIWLEGNDRVCRTLSSRFWKILRHNPSIAMYVRDVHIKDFAPSSRDFEEGQKTRASWMREEETFHNILLVLAKSQITDLSIGTNLDWASFPIGLQHALTQILNAPSLMTLALSSITSLPTSCCTGFVRLKHIRISGITLVDSGDYHEKETKNVSISSLDVTRVKGKSAQLLCNVLALVDNSNPRAALEKLRISKCDAGFTREVILAARESLRCLMISASFPRYNLEIGSVNIRDLHCLNRLEVDVYGPNTLDQWQTEILSLLETGGPNEELRTIHMSFCHSRNCVDLLLHQATAEFWRRLSTTLDRFPSAVEVVIRLVMYLGGEPPDLGERIVQDIRRALGGDRGTVGSVNRVLRVEISEW